MRLLDAILEANHRLASGHPHPDVDLTPHADALPLAALTCIDPRLNHLLPDALGVPEAQFVWLRNAGNIVTGPLSSTVRSLALACLVKNAREIAIIGHSDCLISKTTILALTDRLQAAGLHRAQLPDNLVDFFGLFASERQNVLKAVDLVRRSPLIGPSIPVHGLLLDLPTRRLECLVNGYSTPTPATSPAPTNTSVDVTLRLAGLPILGGKLQLPGFHLGDLKLPDLKIGALSVGLHTTATPAPTPNETPEEAGRTTPLAESPQPSPTPETPAIDWTAIIADAVRYRVIGSDQKLYGPVTGRKLLEWIASGHVDEQTPVQAEGSTLWQPLATLAERFLHPKPLPPVIQPHPTLQRHRRRDDG